MTTQPRRAPRNRPRKSEEELKRPSCTNRACIIERHVNVRGAVVRIGTKPQSRLVAAYDLTETPMRDVERVCQRLRSEAPPPCQGAVAVEYEVIRLDR